MGQIRKGIDGDGVRLGGGTEVAQLSLAGGGYVEAEGHETSVAEGETRDVGLRGRRGPWDKWFAEGQRST